MKRTKIVQKIAERFQPAVLFETNLRAVPALHTELMNVLGSQRANLVQNSSGRIFKTLATDVYQNEEDRNAVVEIVEGIISAWRLNQKIKLAAFLTSQSPQNESSTTISENFAHNMAMRI